MQGHTRGSSTSPTFGAPARGWHGLKDVLPVSHAMRLAERIPQPPTRTFCATKIPDEDHSNVDDNNRAAAFARLKDAV